MAIPVYSSEDLQKIVLNEANAIKGLATPFAPEDMQKCYDEAVIDCGFEAPEEADTNRGAKTFWLLRRMRTWVLKQLYHQYVLQFDTGDMKASQIIKQLGDAIEKEDSALVEARSTEVIFEGYGTAFGEEMVIPTGILEDRVSQQVEQR